MNADKFTKKSGLTRVVSHPISLLSVVGVAIFATWLLVTSFVLHLAPQEFGTIGDSFGAVNALFSGLALAGVIVAIQLQHVELEETRKVLREQHSEMELQAKRGQQEEFDSRFFEVVRFFRTAFNDIITPGYRTENVGNSAVKDILSTLDALERNRSTAGQGQPITELVKMYWHKIETPLQLLHAAVRMLVDEKATQYHGELLRAACPTNARELYYRLLLGGCPGLQHDGQVKKALDKSAFFLGVQCDESNDSIAGPASFGR